MSKWITAMAAAAAAAAFAADNGGMAGPITGFVADARGQSIRPIEGVPGAARLGEPLRLPFAIGFAAIASRQDYALVVPARESRLALARGLRSGAPEAVAIEGAIEPSRIVVASSGNAAALVGRDGRKLQFLAGLPDAPRALEPLDAGALEGSVAAVAIDASGATALLAGADGRIWRARRGGVSLEPIARIPGASSISILPGRDAAAVSSGDTGDVFLIESLDGAISVRSLVGTASAVASVRAVQALDGATVGLISGDGRLGALGIETGAIEWLPLAAEAESFDSLDRSLYVLNRAGAQPLLLLDAAQGRSTWFVPPDRRPVLPRGPGKNIIRGEDRPIHRSN